MLPFNSTSEWLIKNNKEEVIALQAKVANTFLSRLCGLIPQKSLPSDSALIITKCKSIHMVFMRFAIDAIFVNKHHIIVGLVENIKPYQFSKTFWSSSYVIELPPYTISRTKSELGDSLEFFEQKPS